MRGRVLMNFNWDPITEKSAVVIVAAEAKSTGPTLTGTFWSPHRGAADVYVTNIGPHAGGVEFVLHVNWNQPLDVLTDIIVLDNFEQFFEVPLPPQDGGYIAGGGGH
jgi:hypothetical protein